MESRTLGKTGLTVSKIGLGCGGHSKLGVAHGKSEEDAVAVVKHALHLGVNFIDTAEAYGTERFVGNALKSVQRETVVLSSKLSCMRNGRVKTKKEVTDSLEQTLTNLGTDYLDIYHLHGVRIDEYNCFVETMYPVLDEFRRAGKIRFIGITEAFGGDTDHKMLRRAVQDDFWDVIMVGFNFLNQSARNGVLDIAAGKGIGTLNMFAVRKALTSEENLVELLRIAVQKGLYPSDRFDITQPMKSLFNGEAQNTPLADLAYRYCAHEPGLDCILVGTGSKEHLESNINSIHSSQLNEQTLNRLNQAFGDITTFSANPLKH